MTALEHAYKFAQVNIPVFPIQAGGKMPYKGTRGFYDATTDPEQIKAWSMQYPDCNWAMPTGVRSGIVVLDIDPRNGGVESMEDLIEQNGKLPRTPTVYTGGGGVHYYFRVPTIANIKNGEIVAGVDVKTDGGYVIIVGSKTDDTYEWNPERSIFDVEIAEMPGWITIMLQKKNVFDLDEEGYIGEGQRNIYLTSIAGTLRRRGVGRDGMYACLVETNKERCNPPLPDHEVENIANSMMNYEPESDMIRKFMNAAELDLDIFTDAVESQEILIGYLLREDKKDEFAIKILQELKGDQFIDPELSQMFLVIHKMWLNGISLTVENIESSMRDGGLDPAGLVKAGFNIVHATDINFHVNRMLNAWMLRKASAIFAYGADATKTGRREAKDVVNETVSQLMTVLDRSEQSTMQDIKSVMRGISIYLDDADPSRLPYTPYGLPYLDDMVVGAPDGHIIILAGRPSQGKTAFSLKMLEGMAEYDDDPGALVYFSAEMTANELGTRMISTQSKINSYYIRQPWKMNTAQRLKVDEATAYISENWKVYIDDTPSPSPQYMMAKVMAINSHTKVKAVFFDFLELAGIDAADEWAKVNKVLRLEQALIGLKTLAKSLNIPVIILSQLGRDVVNRSGKNQEPAPRMSDLRWSGMIEQLANQIIMVYYPWFFANEGIQFAVDPPVDYYELRIVKNREGEVGTIPIRFIKQYGDFQASEFTTEGPMDLMNRVTNKEELPWEDKE